MPHFLAGRELASEIANRPCPLLFLDTCSILDVLRVPIRPKLPIESLNAVAAMTKFCDPELRRVWLVTSAVVITELKNNVAAVTNELAVFIEIRRARSVVSLKSRERFSLNNGWRRRIGRPWAWTNGLPSW